MKTDIDRLHEVITKGGSRGAGKTFANCHMLAGNVEVLEGETICCLISHYTDVEVILPMLKEVFAEHELEFNVTAGRILTIKTSNNNTIVFIAGSTQGYHNVLDFEDKENDN